MPYFGVQAAQEPMGCKTLQLFLSVPSFQCPTPLQPVCLSSPNQTSMLQPQYPCTCYSARHGWSSLHLSTYLPSKFLLTLPSWALADLSVPSLRACERLKTPA